MPNHVTNRITIYADDNRIQEILESIKSDEVGLGSIDFEKIISPPEDIYRGNVGLEEQRKYGNNTMLSFGYENWDTKWNAYGYDHFFPYEGGNTIEFLTAWSRPEPVIIKLSQMFPDVQFHHAWADEDIGSNVGEILYQNGKELEYNVPAQHTKEAYEMASEIHDLELSEFGLFYDEKSGSYKYGEQEETEEMGGMSLQ